jgi:hypothetical protein
MLVDAVSGDLALHPGVRLTIIPDGSWQRLGPGRVDGKRRSLGFIATAVSQRPSPGDREPSRDDHGTSNIGILSEFHGLPPKGQHFFGRPPLFSPIFI